MTPGYCTEMIHFFIATELNGPGSDKMDLDEQITIIKIKISDAIKMILNGEIQDAKTAYAILAYKSKG